jgi:hypothetical protein
MLIAESSIQKSPIYGWTLVKARSSILSSGSASKQKVFETRPNTPVTRAGTIVSPGCPSIDP